MANSYKNTSSGVESKESGYSKIKDRADPKPPAGASNSYEKVREKIDMKDASSLRKNVYTREKMENK